MFIAIFIKLVFHISEFIMPQILIFILELVGTVSFAVSGAMTALKHKMDVFGVAILGLVTAVGGGVIRDLILGVTPPATFEHPVYALIAVGVSIIIFIPAFRRILTKQQKIYDTMLLLMDSVGLGIFTVVGIRAAWEITDSANVFLLIFVGVITGVGGGVLRDVLAGDTPYIFIKHFYATASIIGAVFCIVFWHYFGETAAMIAGAAVTVVLRILAARFKWSLPHAE